MKGFGLAAIAGLLVACQTIEVRIDPNDSNAIPLADAGTGGTFAVGSTMMLDGTGSFDPDGSLESYRWRVAERPFGSMSTIAGDTAATGTFVLDRPGNYVVELTVTDNADQSATSRVVFHAIGPTLTVDAGADQALQWRTTVSLAGTVAIESGFTYAVEWKLLSQPAGSTVTLSSTTTLTTSFVPDREGDYVLRLIASTPYNSAFDDVRVTATVPRQLLQYVLVDADYSLALDRFVIASDVPPKLRVHDAATNTETSVALPEAPVAVSLEPGGLRAAVAHTNKVTIVNLQTMTVQATHPLPVTLGDVVFGSGNRVYCFHAMPFNNYPIYTLDLASGTVTESQDQGVSGRTNARLHPDGVTIYGATTQISPEDIERYDASGATAAVVRECPYHGDYAMGGQLWFTQDGNAILTRSGNVFYATNDATTDMTYRGTLGAFDHNWIVHSQAAGKLAAVRTTYDAWYNPYQFFLHVYDAQQLTLQRSEMLPDTPFNNMTYASAGRFIAFNAASTKLYVIARVGAMPPGAAHVLYTYDP
jgi:hypothetical protein